MHDKVYVWLLSGHLIGDFLWVGSMFAVYWLLRLHTHAPKEAHEKLVLMERSMALMMDIAAALAIGCGIGLIFKRPTPAFSTIFAEGHAGWFHIKLTVVVLGLLSMHGMLRAKVKKFSRGETPSVPQWQWTVMLSSVVAIVVLVFVVKNAMNAPAEPAATTDSGAPTTPAQ